MGTFSERVLSIQSHVTYGYVGGKAAVFPLQCLGFDVDAINTVSFSNHSGYGAGHFGGSKAAASEITTIISLLEKNGLLNGSRLLTGYIPGAEALGAVRDAVVKLKEKNTELIYLLDPVMGDAGKLYVAPDVIPIYKSMLRLSTIITPNYFEVETLTGIELKDLSSLQTALRILHEEYHVPNVVISSMPFKPWHSAALSAAVRPADTSEDAELLICICSSAKDSSAAPSEVHVQTAVFIPGYFSGVGDLFSALVLAHFKPLHPAGAAASAPTSTTPPLVRAMTAALATTHAVLVRTQEHFLTLPEDECTMTDEEEDTRDEMRLVKRMRGRELRLVQSQDILRAAVTDVDGIGQATPWAGFWTS